MTDQTQNNEAVVAEEGTLVDNAGNTVTLEEAVATTEPPKEEIQYPDWLPEKFKTGEDWQEKMGKSYLELEKSLREKGKVAPEKYEISEDMKAKITPEGLEAFEGLAKDQKMTQEQYEAVLKYADEHGLLDVPDYEGEMAKLGEEKDVIINTLTNYADKNLTPEQAEALEGMVYTAEQARVLYGLIQAADKQIPAKPGSSSKESMRDIEKQLEAVIANPNTKYDMGLQKEAEALAKRMAGMQ